VRLLLMCGTIINRLDLEKCEAAEPTMFPRPWFTTW